MSGWLHSDWRDGTSFPTNGTASSFRDLDSGPSVNRSRAASSLFSSPGAAGRRCWAAVLFQPSREHYMEGGAPKFSPVAAARTSDRTFP